MRNLKNPMESYSQALKILLKSYVLSNGKLAPGSIIAVGDVCAATLLEMGVVADIAIIDGMTKRVELDQKVDTSKFDIMLEANNPAGQITPSLFKAVAAALPMTKLRVSK